MQVTVEYYKILCPNCIPFLVSGIDNLLIERKIFEAVSSIMLGTRKYKILNESRMKNKGAINIINDSNPNEVWTR